MHKKKRTVTEISRKAIYRIKYRWKDYILEESRIEGDIDYTVTHKAKAIKGSTETAIISLFNQVNI